MVFVVSTDIRHKRIQEGAVLPKAEPAIVTHMLVNFGEQLGSLNVQVSYDDGETFVPYHPEFNQ